MTTEARAFLHADEAICLTCAPMAQKVLNYVTALYHYRQNRCGQTMKLQTNLKRGSPGNRHIGARSHAPRDTQPARNGSALIAVMGVALLISMTVIAVVTTGRQQVYSAQRQCDQIKAQMIAEAGANQTYNLVKTNFAACANSNNFPVTDFDGGTYDATVTTVGTNRANISCDGAYRSGRATAKLDIENIPQIKTNAAPTPGMSPYGCTVLAGRDIEWVGNADLFTSNSWFHANGLYTANGVNKLYGNMSSHSGIELVGGASIYGIGRAPYIDGGYVATSMVTSVQLLAIPDLDLTPYYNAALASNQVYSGDRAISGTVTPPGGIMWVNGRLYMGNGTYTGCFIATGGIELQTTGNGTITVTKTQRYPILVSRDGGILVKQAKQFNFTGLIYCKTGSFEKQGNGDVYGIGTIIAAGDVTKNGGWAGMIYQDSTPVPPGGSDVTSSDRVIVTAWQE